MIKRRLSLGAACFLVLCLTIHVAYAQADCPQFVEQTLESVTAVCDAVRRDEACYGNFSVEASGSSDNFTFSEPGDVAAIADIDTLRLAGLDVEDELWGIALLAVQANIPDDAPENVTIALFGDVTLSSRANNGVQVFYVQTGANDRPCAEAPDSGLLIQTPEGLGEIRLLINEVAIELGSTAFIQQAEGVMIFCIIEGEGTVTVGDVTRTVPEGGYTTVEIGADLRPTGRPTPLAGYDESGLEALPISLLPREIEIAEGLTQEDLRDIAADAEVIPQAGTWQVTGTRGVCHNLAVGYVSGTGALIFGTGTLTVDDEGASFTFTGENGDSTHERGAPGQYVLAMDSPETPGATDTYDTTVNSPTAMTTTITHVSTTTECETISGTATWTWVGP
ncbi:MAG: hypothetical protein HXY40_10220 [Chloroflexi bacterium]|nr:hypothetical protein [Chloroflexota bacterium]